MSSPNILNSCLSFNIRQIRIHSILATFLISCLLFNGAAMAKSYILLDWTTPFGELKVRNGSTITIDGSSLGLQKLYVSTGMGPGNAFIEASGNLTENVLNSDGTQINETIYANYYVYANDPSITTNPKQLPVTMTLDSSNSGDASSYYSYAQFTYACGGPDGYFCADEFVDFAPTAYYASQLTITAVPEPKTWVLMLLGLTSIGLINYQRKRILTSAL